MKKLLLIVLIGVAIVFTNCSVEAKMFPPLFYDTNFKVDNQATTEQEKNLFEIIYKFRYADAITVISANDYIKLLNIQADQSFSNSEIQSILNDLGYTSYNFNSTNKTISYLTYIIFYQKKYKNQLNSKVAQLTDAQRKKYAGIAKNLQVSSSLYEIAKTDLENYIQANGNSYKYSKLVTGLGFNEQLVDTVYQGMSGVSKNTTSATVPNVITLDMVKAKEADAIIQWTNISLGEQPNLSSKELAASWGTKANAYFYKSDYANTISCLDKVISYSPSNSEFWGKRAFSKWSLADFNGAISDYTKAIELGSNDVTNYYNRACAKVLIGQNESAANDFKKVAQMSQYSNNSSLAALAVTYNKALSESDKDNSDFVKNKIFFENPIMLRNYMKKNGKMPIDVKGNSSQQEADKKASEMIKQMTANQQQKQVIPVGCRVYMIIGRLKDSHTEVRYTTIAPINKIEDIVNADPRFEWVRYESVPDSYLGRYPRY